MTYPPPTPQNDTNPFISGFQSGLSDSVGSAINSYYENQKKEKIFGGASDILSNLPKDYDLEDILSIGKQMGAKPDAIQMALNIGQTSQQVKSNQQKQIYQMAQMAQRAQRQEDRANQQDPQYKAAVTNYSTMVNNAKKMGDLSKKAEAMEELIDSGAQTNVSHLVEIMGRDNPVGRALQLVEGDKAAAFNVLGKSFLEYFKSTFPTRFTDKDLMYIQSAVPSLARSEAQNRQTLKIYKAMADKYKKEVEIANRIVRDNGGTVPTDLNERIDSEIAPYEDAIEKMKLQSSPEYAYMTGGASVTPGYTKVTVRGQEMQVPNEKLEQLKAAYPDAVIGRR